MTERKEKALASLLTSRTRREAAKAAGISERTLYKYLLEPDFRDAYQATISGIVADVTRQIQNALSPAVDALLEVVTDTEAGAMARITAARTILDFGLRFTEAVDFIQRLEALERERENQEPIETT